jgi:Phage major capsid protein E
MGGNPLPINVLTGQLQIELTTYATGYRQNSLVADILFPRIPAPLDTDRYIKFGREAMELSENDLRAKGAAAEQIRQVLSDDSFHCVDHSLAAVIEAADLKKYVLGDLRQFRVATIMAKLLLQKEKRAATLIADTATITQNTTLVGGDQWSDPVNSNPAGDVETAKNTVMKTGSLANVLVINPDVFAALKVNEQVKSAFKYTTPGAIGLQQLASFFTIDRVLLAAGVISSAGVASFVFGKHAFLAYVSPAESMEDPSFGKTFVWEGAPYTVGGTGVITGPVGSPSAQSEEVSAHFWYDQKVTFAESAYVIKNAAA